MTKSRRGKRVAEKKAKAARSRMVLVPLALGVLVIAAGLWGWHRLAPPSISSNILLISVDTLRPDHLGCYGYTAIRTPNIDRLAAEGESSTRRAARFRSRCHRTPRC